MKTLLSKAKWYLATAFAGFMLALYVFQNRNKLAKRPVTSVSFDPNDIPPEPVPVTHAARVDYLRKEGLVK